MRIDLMSPADYIAVQYKGAQYMCVRNSKRHMYLHDANRAWLEGCHGMAEDLLNRALASTGCAFEHREAQGGAEYV